MKKFTVVFCDGSPSLTANAVSFFQNDQEINLITCSSATAVEDVYDDNTVNAIIIDIAFPNCREILSSLPVPRPKIVVTSRLMQEEIGGYLRTINFDECFFKPYSFSELKSKLLKLLQLGQYAEKYELTPKAMDERLSNIFIRAGIPPHIKGYQFLREAVKLAVNCPDMINCITKKLYPSVAHNFDTTASKVERAIRHAIEVAWNRGKIENINAIFGIKIYNKGEKPTNGELIALVADKVMIEMM